MQQQQAHPASAAAAACRRTCLPSPRLGKSARRDWRCRPSSSQGGGRPASLDGDTASMAKAYGGFFRGKRARAILNYRGDEHSESGTRVRCTVEQQKRDVGLRRVVLRASSQLGPGGGGASRGWACRPSSSPLPGSPRDGKQAGFSRRIHPDGDFQGAIRTAHGAAWSVGLDL